MTDIDIQNAPIRWKVPGAGFIGVGGFVVLVDRDPDPFPCVVFDGTGGGTRSPREDVPGELGHRMGAGRRHVGGSEAGPG